MTLRDTGVTPLKSVDFEWNGFDDDVSEQQGIEGGWDAWTAALWYIDWAGWNEWIGDAHIDVRVVIVVLVSVYLVFRALLFT